jgi:TonB family protein
MPASTPPLAAEPHPHPASPPPPPSTLDPEPPSPSFFPALRLPNLKRSAFRIPASPRTPAAQIFSAQLRIVLISGIGATLFVAALMAAAHHSANAVLRTATRSAATPALKPATSPAPTPATNNPPPVAAAPAAAATTAATGAAPIPSPSPSSPHPRHPAHSSRDDGYIAPPWSTPIPAQLAAAGATPGVSSASTTPSVASARSEKPDKPDKPIGPDTALGSSPISPPTRHLSVASGQMAILSAPPPGYPMLARIAHVQGRVVVEAVVDPNGAVSTAHVLSGHRLLRGAALGAVLQRRYRPYRVDGHPVEVSTTITLNFSSQH